jgi:hypothetical protein
LQNHSAANAARDAHAESLPMGFENTKTRAHMETSAWNNVPPPINLDQLTDQVARRIDDRITAYRERRGKGA